MKYSKGKIQWPWIETQYAYIQGTGNTQVTTEQPGPGMKGDPPTA
jgi:hypothetical protein